MKPASRAGSQERRVVLFAAIAANLAIAVVKFVAAAVTGSISVAAEGVHSLVDTGDGVLLFVGQRLARRPADDRFPFGRGKEVYFWSMVVAMVIFGAGGAVTFYEGISHVRDRSAIDDPTWSFVVLGCAALLESTTLVIAVRSLYRYRERRMPRYSLFATIRAAKDPTVFTVVLEDSAALVGLVLAFFGVLLSDLTGDGIYDGIASCAIGLVLAAIAVVLARECRGLLLGERALVDVVAGIGRIADASPAVARVLAVQTMHIGPEAVLAVLRLRLHRELAGVDVLRSLAALDDDVRARFPEVIEVCIDLATLGERALPARPQPG